MSEQLKGLRFSKNPMRFLNNLRKFIKSKYDGKVDFRYDVIRQLGILIVCPIPHEIIEGEHYKDPRLENENFKKEHPKKYTELHNQYLENRKRLMDHLSNSNWFVELLEWFKLKQKKATEHHFYPIEIAHDFERLDILYEPVTSYTGCATDEEGIKKIMDAYMKHIYRKLEIVDNIKKYLIALTGERDYSHIVNKYLKEVRPSAEEDDMRFERYLHFIEDKDIREDFKRFPTLRGEKRIKAVLDKFFDGKRNVSFFMRDLAVDLNTGHIGSRDNALEESCYKLLKTIYTQRGLVRTLSSSVKEEQATFKLLTTTVVGDIFAHNDDWTVNEESSLIFITYPMGIGLMKGIILNAEKYKRGQYVLEDAMAIFKNSNVQAQNTRVISRFFTDNLMRGVDINKEFHKLGAEEIGTRTLVFANQQAIEYTLFRVPKEKIGEIFDTRDVDTDFALLKTTDSTTGNTVIIWTNPDVLEYNDIEEAIKTAVSELYRLPKNLVDVITECYERGEDVKLVRQGDTLAAIAPEEMYDKIQKAIRDSKEDVALSFATLQNILVKQT